MAASGVVNSETFKVTTPSDTEIHFTRLFDAPRHLVFEAMSKPEHIKRWWGNLGDGYSVPVCEVDLRVGGKWRFINRHLKATPPSKEVRDMVLGTGMEKGAAASYDRLDEVAMSLR